jgi:hypothetical protein
VDDSSISYLSYVLNLRCCSGMVGWERREVLLKIIQNYDFPVCLNFGLLTCGECQWSSARSVLLRASAERCPVLAVFLDRQIGFSMCQLAAFLILECGCLHVFSIVSSRK